MDVSYNISDRYVPGAIDHFVTNIISLYPIRTLLGSAANSNLNRLRNFDERIEACIDGLAIAGRNRDIVLDSVLERITSGSVFLVAASALRNKNFDRLSWLYALSSTEAGRLGIVGALAWAEKSTLVGTVHSLLQSADEHLRLLGIAACAVHRVDANKSFESAICSESELLCGRALRALGELGKTQSIRLCLGMLTSKKEALSFWAAHSAVILGDRNIGLETLRGFVLTANPYSSRAVKLAVQAGNHAVTLAWLRDLAKIPGLHRSLITASGVTGDSRYVPWLIRQMAEPKFARLAGEAFTLISGVQIGEADLEEKKSSELGKYPSDDPSDPNVAMDEDDGLPWPDPERISKWWASNGSRFTAGTRYFMGAPVDRDNCLRVLKDGFQRQRILAAHYLCLLEPGTPLFEWRAPAYRQQRLLASMS